MKIDWQIEDRLVTFNLYPETEGDQVLLEYVSEFRGMSVKRKEDRYGYSYNEKQEIISAYISLVPCETIEGVKD